LGPWRGYYRAWGRPRSGQALITASAKSAFSERKP
jgi:hypothetical protein